MRITPAHAGKRHGWRLLGYTGKDHPRTRGEKCVITLFLCVITGSPPHTRGKVQNWKRMYQDNRITPAHAGKRLSPAVVMPIIRDHPRTRGEKVVAGSRDANHKGSPPHTRGKAADLGKKLADKGITPAHAGKSDGEDIFTGCKGDHPRTRGEKIHLQYLPLLSQGSPPHTRGKVNIPHIQI